MWIEAMMPKTVSYELSPIGDPIFLAVAHEPANASLHQSLLKCWESPLCHTVFLKVLGAIYDEFTLLAVGMRVEFRDHS